ncbi:MAG: D-2-hydroxyacid dehydrogenase [Acidimicrobiales bacterium]
MKPSAPSTNRVHGAQRSAMAVAAPPWAAHAFEMLEAAGVLDVPVRHVVIDPDVRNSPSTQGVRVLWRYHLTPEQLSDAMPRLPDLRWVHSDYVGVDDLPLGELAERGIMLSNGAGISAGPMAEWVVLALLLAVKQLPRFVRQSDARTWEAGVPLKDLRGSTVLLLGLGAVGTLVASLLEPFGVEVRAATRRSRRELPPGVSRNLVGDQWRSGLGDADFVVCTLPLTPGTAGMLGAATFEAMKPGAWVVNISRGGLVDEVALLEALDAGHLGGAVLDAFRQEPLLPADPLWARPDVLVLPHVTWSSSHTLDDFKWRFAAQLRRFAGGQPPADLVDLAAGY